MRLDRSTLFTLRRVVDKAAEVLRFVTEDLLPALDEEYAKLQGVDHART